jgi:hypothetical protein
MIQRRHLENRRTSRLINFEHEGRRFIVSASRFPNGRLAEIFLDCDRPNSAVAEHASNCAILVSLLLQHSVDSETIRHSITGPVATALELVEDEQ